MTQSLERRWDLIRQRLVTASVRSGRPETAVRVIGVTKTVTVEGIREAVRLGLRDFGENRLQEALPKIQELKSLGLTWHFIGRIQGNKSRKIAEGFDWIQSVGNVATIESIERALAERAIERPVLLQVNVADEETKSGFSAREVIDYFESGRFRDLRFVRLSGMMGIGPNTEEEGRLRRFFADLRNCRDICRKYCPGFEELSMGMSRDFEWAVEEGATMVRIGTALFGERNS